MTTPRGPGVPATEPGALAPFLARVSARLADLLPQLVRVLARHWLLLANIVLTLQALLPYLAPALMQLGYLRAGHNLYSLYVPLCHQLPERSFFAGGYQLPVCARDTGIYAGFALGLLALWLLSRSTKPTELPRWPVLVLMSVFVGAMAIDGLTSYAGLRETTNAVRLVTGTATGWALATVTVPMVNSQLWVLPGRGRVVEGPGRVLAWLGLLALSLAVLQWVMPLAGVVYPLLVSAAIVVTFIAVNLVFVGLMPPFERKATRLRDAWPQMLVALALTVGELALAGGLRVVLERFG